MTVQVSLRDACKTFVGPSGPVHALGPISLELRHGEFFAVVGPSGCGKSTMLELIAGLSIASIGEVAFEGQPIRGRIPDGVGVVFQEDASFPWLTVHDNIAFGLRRAGLPKAEPEARIEAALAMMGRQNTPRLRRIAASPRRCSQLHRRMLPPRDLDRHPHRLRPPCESSRKQQRIRLLGRWESGLSHHQRRVV